jgi:hypothetical protein
MPRKPAQSIEVACPCCQAKLTVDPELAVVLSHVPPPKPPPSVDLDDTARLLREQAERVEAKFRNSVEAEKMKEDVLERKFREGLKKAKDQPVEKPLRDFDLD